MDTVHVGMDLRFTMKLVGAFVRIFRKGILSRFGKTRTVVLVMRDAEKA